MLTVEDILSAIDQLPPTEQREFSRIFSNRQIAVQPPDRVNSSIFWQRVEQFRSEIQIAEIDVEEIWANVRDSAPGREVEL